MLWFHREEPLEASPESEACIWGTSCQDNASHKMVKDPLRNQTSWQYKHPYSSSSEKDQFSGIKNKWKWLRL